LMERSCGYVNSYPDSSEYFRSGLVFWVVVGTIFASVFFCEGCWLEMTRRTTIPMINPIMATIIVVCGFNMGIV